MTRQSFFTLNISSGEFMRVENRPPGLLIPRTEPIEENRSYVSHLTMLNI
jgi:hypothetical protein